MPDVRAPEVCPTCDGEGYVDLTHGQSAPIRDGVLFLYRPCPACTVCPECGEPEPTGLPCRACREEEALDWVDVDYQNKVTDGSR